MKRFVLLLIVLWIATTATAIDFIVKEDTDHAFPVTLVDATDGYTPETEKKAADTTEPDTTKDEGDETNDEMPQD